MKRENRADVKVGDKLWHKMYNRVVIVDDFLDEFEGESVPVMRSEYVVFNFETPIKLPNGEVLKQDTDSWKYLKKN